MRIVIKKIWEKTQEQIKNFASKINNNDIEFDETEVCLEVKHILEDMQSVLDYIAVDIHDKYCPTHNFKKIYFLYTNEKEQENNFINKINIYFPKLYSNNFDVYNILANVQSFKDNSNWLIKLNDLTNEVKHNDLYINKIEQKKNATLRSKDAAMFIDGNLKMQKTSDGYGVFGTGSVYVGGTGNISFYGDGNIAIGSGMYNVDTGEKNGVETEIVIKKVVKSKKYDESILNILNLIITKEQELINNLEQYI